MVFPLVQTLASEMAGIAFVLQGVKRALTPLQLCGYLVSTGVVPTNAQPALLWDCGSCTTSRGQICSGNKLKHSSVEENTGLTREDRQLTFSSFKL